MTAPAAGRTVRVGVVGVGVMGADHARQLSSTVPGARVVAVADVNGARAQQVAEQVGARVADDPSALIGSGDVDAVAIASADATHADLVRACVAAGKPVLCEKPLAPSLTETADLVGGIGADGVRLVSVGYMRRFDPGYAELREVVRSGRYGQPLVVHCVSRGVSAGIGATSESSITGASTHDLDVVPWLLGVPIVEAAWLAPRQSREAAGLQDPQVLLLRMADGVLCTVETYLNARYGYDIRCEIVCETGTVSLAEPHRVVTGTELASRQSYWPDWRGRFADAYRLELAAWIRCAGGASPPTAPLATVTDALAAAEVAEALIRSMARGGGFVSTQQSESGPVR
jgi:myo-inositol 2-dehydrogenase/D-chiro-inositol 1-dehydrogenase